MEVEFTMTYIYLTKDFSKWSIDIVDDVEWFYRRKTEDGLAVKQIEPSIKFIKEEYDPVILLMKWID